MIINIQRFTPKELTKSHILSVLELQNTVWPTDQEIAKQYATYIHVDATQPKFNVLIAQESHHLIGYAEFFSRTIISAEEQLEVGCLANVCVLPQRQRKGVGKAIVQAAFSLVKADEFPVFLFQTGVPEFYIKLGARLIDNQFINTKSDQPYKNPWWDKHVMIYPASFPWFEGLIDLNGQGF